MAYVTILTQHSLLEQLLDQNKLLLQSIVILIAIINFTTTILAICVRREVMDEKMHLVVTLVWQQVQ